MLYKCESEDFNYIQSVLKSYLPFSGSSKLAVLWMKYQETPGLYKQALVEEIDNQIRYFGSSNFAYLKRCIDSLDNQYIEPCVSASEVVNDVFSKLKVKIKLGPSSIETRLQRLVSKVVEHELLKMPPEKLTEAFKSIGMGDADINNLLEKIQKSGKIAILPVLIKILGPEITLNVIQTIIVSMLAQITGAEAAKQLMKEVIRRNPWMNALGPIVWVLSSSWFAYDMQGPAFRKTIPICLYLGIVSMRKTKKN
ncbi:MAG: hypothetical protein HQL46_16200 [Gammaproteobacteria bacterium]|nr:hypothetical protein [Gammaproteobacteria bacterium]